MPEISIGEVRAKFPQYNDLSDQQLADGLHRKYYPDMDRAEFDRRIGLARDPQAPSGLKPLEEQPDGKTIKPEAPDSGHERKRTTLTPENEAKFHQWYQWYAGQNRLDPNPDNPLHKYDYRGWWSKIQTDPATYNPVRDPRDGMLHGPQEFKDYDHPTAWKGRFMADTGINPDDAGYRTEAEARAAHPSKKEDDWGTAALKTLQNVPDMFKRFVGAAIMQWGEDNAGNRLTAGLKALDRFNALPPEQRDGDTVMQMFKEEIAKDPTVTKGREIHSEAVKALQENAPKVTPHSAKYYAAAALQAIIEMGPSVALSIATRNPGMGMALIGGQVYVDQYAQSRAKGRTPQEAQQDALFFAATEALSEGIPLGILTREGGKMLARVLKAAGAEGIQEVVNQAMQMGYQIGVLDEKMTLGQAMMALVDAGIIGFLAGGGLGIITQPFAGGQPQPDTTPPPQPKSGREKLRETLEDPRSIDEIRKADEKAAREQEWSLAEEAKKAEEAARQSAGIPISGAEATITVPGGESFTGKIGSIESADDTTYFQLATADGEIFEFDAGQVSISTATGAGTQIDPVKAESIADVDKAAQNVNTEPTEGQKKAGNYQKGHVNYQGLDIAIENPRGSTRSGVDPDGTPWETPLFAHYGYIKRTEGADGDQVDVYLGLVDTDRVFIVDQIDANTREFDEHKVILGAQDALDARDMYTAHFSDGRGNERMGGMTEMTVDQFKEWLKDGNSKKPVSPLGLEQEQSAVAPGDVVASPVEAPVESPPGPGSTAAAPAAAPDAHLPFVPQAQAFVRSRDGGPITPRMLINAIPGLDAALAQRLREHLLAQGILTRRGYAPRHRKTPRHLLDIIREMGGLQPGQQGEVESRDLRIAAPGLIRGKGKGGRTAHEVREHLEELGILPQFSQDDAVFDLIDDHLRGKRVYHPEDGHLLNQMEAKLADEANQEAMTRALGEVDAEGVPLSNAEREEAAMAFLAGESAEDSVERVVLRADANATDQFAEHLPPEYDDIPFPEIATNEQNNRTDAGEPAGESRLVPPDGQGGEDAGQGPERGPAGGEDAGRAGSEQAAEGSQDPLDIPAFLDRRNQAPAPEAGVSDSGKKPAAIRPENNNPTLRAYIKDQISKETFKALDQNNPSLTVEQANEVAEAYRGISLAPGTNANVAYVAGNVAKNLREQIDAVAPKEEAPAPEQQPVAETAPDNAPEYEAARKKHDAASSKYHGIARKYQAGEIGDAEFDAAQKEYKAATDEFDAAYAKEQAKPATETVDTADGKKEQYVMPGAEVTDKDRLRVAGEKKMGAGRPQRDMNVGMFGSDVGQLDLVDQAREASKKAERPIADLRREYVAAVMEADGIPPSTLPQPRRDALVTRAKELQTEIERRSSNAQAARQRLSRLVTAERAERAERKDKPAGKEPTIRQRFGRPDDTGLYTITVNGVEYGTWKEPDGGGSTIPPRGWAYYRTATESVTDAHYGGDTMASAYEAMEKDSRKGEKFMAAAYHGTPHDFDNFSTKHIGSGEGAQAYGWGLYFAGRKEVAQFYKEKLSDRRQELVVDGQPIGVFVDQVDAEYLTGANYIAAQEDHIDRIAGWLEQQGEHEQAETLRAVKVGPGFPVPKISVKRGRLYTVNLAPAEDEYLLWDKPLSQQSPKVKAALRDYLQLGQDPEVWEDTASPGPYRWHVRIGKYEFFDGPMESREDAEHNAASDKKMSLAERERVVFENATGEDFYQWLSRSLTARSDETGMRGWTSVQPIENDKAASKALAAAGIPGIKYLDGSSRNKPLKDIKRAFLDALPEDSEADEVADLIGTGHFTQQQDAVLKALQADDWLGFDYPAQAISAALNNNLSNWDPSPALVQAVSEIKDQGTYNYVIFDESSVKITDKERRGAEKLDLTPEQRADLSEKIKAAVKALAPDAKLEFVDELLMPNGERAAGSYTPGAALIKVALEFGQKGTETVRHEVIHALRDLGLITDAEWAVLERKAKREWIKKHEIEKNYADLDAEGQAEEAVAQAFAVNKDAGSAGSTIQKVFARIRQFFERLRNALHGLGFQTAEDIFAKIESGEVGRRGAAASKGGDVKLSRQDNPGNPDRPRADEARERAQDERLGRGRPYEENAQADLHGEPISELPEWAERERPPTPRQRVQQGTFSNHFFFESRSIVDFLRDRNMTLMDRLRGAKEAFWRDAGVKLQDRFLEVKRIQETIARTRGTPIDEAIDAYLLEELYHGRTGKRLDDFRNDHVQPLIDAIGNADLSLEQVELYLYARHAPERNAQIARINPEMQDGGSGMTNAEAADIMQTFQTTGIADALEGIARQIDTINRNRISLMRQAGLIDQRTADAWQRTYPHYVPLRGFEHGAEIFDDQPDNAQRTGKGFDIRGQESKRAMGRESRAANILANTLAMYEEAVIRSEKNRVGKAFLRLVQQNPDTALWEIDERAYIRTINRQTGLVEWRADPFYQNKDNVFAVKVDGRTHYITIHHKGLARAMKGLGSESMNLLVKAFAYANRYLAAVNTSFSPEFVISNFFRDLQTAGINLSEFEVEGLRRNVIKDIWRAMRGVYGGLHNRRGTEWERHYHEFADEGGKIAFFGMDDLATRQRQIESLLGDVNPTTARKARMAGRALKDFVQDVNAAVENAVRLSTFVNLRRRGVSPAQAASAARNLTVNFNKKGEWGAAVNAFYLFYNASLQGSVRVVRALGHRRVRRLVAGVIVFNIGMEILNAAMSPDDDDERKAYDKISPWTKDHNFIVVNPLWKFRNKRKDEKQEDYENEIIAFKLPLPYGYNVFHVLGRKIGEVSRRAMGDDEARLATPMSAVMDVLAIALDSFNPLGTAPSIAQFLTPTFARPFIQLQGNENFMGQPIMPPEDPFAKSPKPDSERYFRSATSASKWFAKKFNELMGGNEVRSGKIFENPNDPRSGWDMSFSPETIDHFFDFLTGGLGMFARKGTDYIWRRLVSGEDVEWNDVPFARKVIEGRNKWADRERYLQIRESVATTEKEIKLARDKNDKALFDSIHQKHAVDVQMIGAVKKAEDHIRKINKRLRVVDNMKDEKKKKAETERLEQVRIKVMRNIIKQHGQRRRNQTEEKE